MSRLARFVSAAFVDPELTLSEGRERYAAANRPLLALRDMSEPAAQFFRCHDVALVLSGCDPTLSGEGTVKLWTIFGTNLCFWKHLRGYSEASAISCFRQYSCRHLAGDLGRSMRSVPSMIRRARRMHHR